MKVLLLTPGTGNFHCGSCLHDQALVRGLRSLGHDAAITALYLPLVLDRKDGIDGDDVRMNGISLYLQSKSAVFRLLAPVMRGLLSRPSLLRQAADRADMTSPSELGRMTEQMLLGGAGKTRHEIDRLIKHIRQHDRPDVVLLNNALLLGMARPIAEALGCAVACTLQGEDTFLDSLPEPWRSRAWELLAAHVKDTGLFLPVSAYHGELMAKRLGIADHKICVVYNGIETDAYTEQDQAPNPPVIGYLARLCKNKGLGTLVDAFIAIHKQGQLPDAQLHVVGAATSADLRYVDEQRQKLVAAGLSDRFRIDTNVTFDDKVRALRGMSVLSVPATYGESFGLYVLEANAVGVPAVVPDHAGLSEVIGQTGGGILYAPDSVGSLADQLVALIHDEPRRRALGQAGMRAVRERFTASAMARAVALALEPICQANT